MPIMFESIQRLTCTPSDLVIMKRQKIKLEYSWVYHEDKILLMISEVCIILIIHNSTCIPPALAAIVPTHRPGPLKTHLFASQDPIHMHHLKSARGSKLLNGE